MTEVVETFRYVVGRLDRLDTAIIGGMVGFTVALVVMMVSQTPPPEPTPQRVLTLVGVESVIIAFYAVLYAYLNGPRDADELEEGGSA